MAYTEEEQKKIEQLFISLGFSAGKLNEEELKQFFQPRVTPIRNEWPTLWEEETYALAGLGSYSAEGLFEFNFAYPPAIKNKDAYELLRSKGLVSERGLPRDPRTGFEPKVID